jgi:SNF2 family DNA or RNA helicase
MGELTLTLRHNPTAVVVRRDAGVDDLFWLRVWAEWSSDGRDPNREVVVPVEVFLRNMAWFAPACKLSGVQPRPDDGVRQVVNSRRTARNELESVANSISLSETSVRERLEGSRFSRELRSFQLRDLGKLLSLSNGANFSVPGAGKTTVTYALYEAERQAGRVSRLLVVAPISAFGAWFDEAAASLEPCPVVRRYDGASAIGADVEVLVVNYQRLSSSYASLSQWVAAAPTMVVLDEAHRMKKGWSGQWGSYCLSLALLAARRDVLTGTPAPQSPADLEALFDFLWPGQARSILPSDALRPNPSQSTVNAVAASIDPLFTRTTKTELALPTVNFNAVVVPPTGIQRDIYDGLRSRLLSNFDLTQNERVDLGRMGQVVMYLLEAASNPCLLPVGSSESDIFRHPPLPIPADSSLFHLIENYAKYETPSKFIELAKIVRSNAEQGRKTLVWTNFVRNLQTLERQLAVYKPALVHGGIPSSAVFDPSVRTREVELDRFRHSSDCAVLLANPAAMSEGVSLHDVCHDAVYLDRTFNAGQYLQSVDRIHRLGLSPDSRTEVTFLLTDDTVDMVVDGRIRVKADRLAQMLNDASITQLALPDDDDYGPAIDSGEDIAALFAHLRGSDDRTAT